MRHVEIHAAPRMAETRDPKSGRVTAITIVYPDGSDFTAHRTDAGALEWYDEGKNAWRPLDLSVVPKLGRTAAQAVRTLLDAA